MINAEKKESRIVQLDVKRIVGKAKFAYFQELKVHVGFKEKIKNFLKIQIKSGKKSRKIITFINGNVQLVRYIKPITEGN